MSESSEIAVPPTNVDENNVEEAVSEVAPAKVQVKCIEMEDFSGNFPLFLEKNIREICAIFRVFLSLSFRLMELVCKVRLQKTSQRISRPMTN